MNALHCSALPVLGRAPAAMASWGAGTSTGAGVALAALLGGRHAGDSPVLHPVRKTTGREAEGGVMSSGCAPVKRQRSEGRKCVSKCEPRCQKSANCEEITFDCPKMSQVT